MIIRMMESSDVNFAFECTSAEKWAGETKEVFEDYLVYGKKGCFIAEKDMKQIGMCVAIQYEKNGFIGELIIIKDMRGRGYGSKLFQHSVFYLKASGIQNIYLDGDLEAVPIYEKYGFKKKYKSLRFSGKITGKNHSSVQKTTLEDLDRICEMDLDLFGDDRSFFIKRRYELHPNLCFVLKEKNELLGYVMARPGVGLISVGPMIFRQCDVNPLVMLERLSLEIGEHKMRFGILENNGEATKFFRSISDLKEETPCWRMGLGEGGSLGLSNEIYAIGSAAKG